MKLQEIYDFLVSQGIELDPRGKQEVLGGLETAKKNFEQMPQKEKAFFDKEQLTNPYSDTRIVFGNKDAQIKNILVGIDIDVGEILLADRLNQKGMQVDLVLSHHPRGAAVGGLHQVMHMQAAILEEFGVPISIAEGLLDNRIKEVGRRFAKVNITQVADAAKLLEMPLMCMHTPADNAVAQFIKKAIDERKPDILENIIDLLREIPEYKDAALNNAGPKIEVGKPQNKAGKIVVEMTGGTEGPKEVLSKLANAGVSTIIAMHFSDEHLKVAQDEHINIIIAGHISSDTLGLNLLLDRLSKKDKFNIISCSGFRRFER